MKFKSIDDIILMEQCITVKQMEYGLNYKKAQQELDSTRKSDSDKIIKLKRSRDYCLTLFNECETVKKSISNSRVRTLEEINNDNIFEDCSRPFNKRVISPIMSRPKFAVINNHYNRAIKVAEDAELLSDTSKHSKRELIKQFFTDNRISTLRFSNLKNRVLIATAGTLAVALVIGGVVSSNFSSRVIPAQESTYTSSAETPSTPSVTESPTLENTIPANAKKADLLNDFKQRYATEYNSENSGSVSANDLEIYFNKHNYIYEIQVGDQTRYVSHGKYPNMIEQYLEDNNIEYKAIRDTFGDFKVTSAFEKNGSVSTQYDDFGNKLDYTGTRLESAVHVNGEWVKLFDGNNPKSTGLLDPNVLNYNTLEDMSEAFYRGIIYDPNKADRNGYIKALEDYYQENSLEDEIR